MPRATSPPLSVVLRSPLDAFASALRARASPWSRIECLFRATVQATLKQARQRTFDASFPSDVLWTNRRTPRSGSKNPGLSYRERKAPYPSKAVGHLSPSDIRSSGCVSHLGDVRMPLDAIGPRGERKCVRPPPPHQHGLSRLCWRFADACLTVPHTHRPATRARNSESIWSRSPYRSETNGIPRCGPLALRGSRFATPHLSHGRASR